MNLIYTDDNQQKLDNFIRSFRFVINLCNAVGDDAIKNKLDRYISQNRTVYDQALYLFERQKTCTHFNAHRVRREIFAFLEKNRAMIDNLNDAVFPLGKAIKQYDPGKTQGYY